VKKQVDIEALLTWAYRDELPKQSVGGLTGWERTILLGTRVDESNRDHDVELPVALGPPHPDALTLDHAVRSLEDMVLTLPIARVLIGDLAPYLTREVVHQVVGRRAGYVVQERTEKVDAVKHRSVSPTALVTLHAKLGNRPHWDLGPVRVSRVTGSNGKPVVNGITRGRRYANGAHCPLRLDPSPDHIIRARFDYAAWHGALTALATCRMTEHQALPPRAAVEPWITGETPTSRILKPISRPHIN
jgi:hypothetical protein